MTAVAPGAKAPSPVGGSAVLHTDDVRKQYRGVVAVSGASVEVRLDEVLGVIGPNGAGKTTLFNLIAGSVRPSGGRVIHRGRDITRMSAHRRRRIGISRTFQLIKPFASLTVRDNVYVAATASGARPHDAHLKVDAVLERYGLGSIAERSAGSINVVEGKRLEIARALVSEPEVILLDEVFSGLNSDEVSELGELVTAMRSATTAVMLIEHNVGAIRTVAQRTIAMTEGAIVCEGTPDEVLNDPRVQESYLGVKSRT